MDPDKPDDYSLAPTRLGQSKAVPVLILAAPDPDGLWPSDHSKARVSELI